MVLKFEIAGGEWLETLVVEAYGCSVSGRSVDVLLRRFLKMHLHIKTSSLPVITLSFN
jgi:hypothetical protein